MQVCGKGVDILRAYGCMYCICIYKSNTQCMCVCLCVCTIPWSVQGSNLQCKTQSEVASPRQWCSGCPGCLGSGTHRCRTPAVKTQGMMTLSHHKVGAAANIGNNEKSEMRNIEGNIACTPTVRSWVIFYTSHNWLSTYNYRTMHIVMLCECMYM